MRKGLPPAQQKRVRSLGHLAVLVKKPGRVGVKKKVRTKEGQNRGTTKVYRNAYLPSCYGQKVGCEKKGPPEQTLLRGEGRAGGKRIKTSDKKGH